MCRGKDDCCACRFDKCVETLCENGIDAIRAVFSRSNPAVQYPVDVEKEDIRFLFTNADMETTRAP